MHTNTATSLPVEVRLGAPYHREESQLLKEQECGTYVTVTNSCMRPTRESSGLLGGFGTCKRGVSVCRAHRRRTNFTSCASSPLAVQGTKSNVGGQLTCSGARTN
jgi:hypothetical protein